MNNTWALVLAAGEGSRLRALTTHRGVAVPKQFCSLVGGPSLLEEAVLRAEAIVPRQRVCTIVAEQHRVWWEEALRFMPRRNVIVQPQNRGTAVGLLLPLLHIAQRDPQARIVILPSDHYVRDEVVLARALRQAASRLTFDTQNLWLLGISPEAADPELGYIVPGNRDEAGALRVAQFVEKPPVTLARLMIERGGLWNAFILAGAVQAILRLFYQRYPQLLNDMRAAVQLDASSPDEAVAATDLYRRLPELDFSRHVLEGSEATLRVLPVPACGWSDLGTPRRVSEALRRLSPDGTASQETASILNLAAQHARLQLAV
ncbi:MAG TPA: sugar phosphate nucleotidyltransferase [Steroidobacteraceae bacterium]|nr:sugar phosphate nucleotidyltransferase [Steroidobacteraceae bacterium]